MMKKLKPIPTAKSVNAIFIEFIIIYTLQKFKLCRIKVSQNTLTLSTPIKFIWIYFSRVGFPFLKLAKGCISIEIQSRAF